MNNPSRAELVKRYFDALNRMSDAKAEFESAREEFEALELQLYPETAHRDQHPPVRDTTGMP